MGNTNLKSPEMVDCFVLKNRRLFYNGRGILMLASANIALAALDAGAIVWWLVVGLIAGALAGLVMRGGGYGIVGDIVVGLVGALVGGFLAGLVGLGSSGFVGSIIIAFIGACVFIAILRAVSGGSRRAL
jgi:uncharacterized membrane protein YeaQ/YmgE (transglycosylase-associated protein family)